MVGTAILHYRILSKLGEGGMGVVYLAEDLKLQRMVALKFPPTGLSETDRERFLREARAAALIRHPNVCPIHAIEEAHGRLFFVMAYIKGPTLGQLAAKGPLPVERAVELALQIAAGLDAAHQQGLVHRDIKSGNVIVDEHGNAVILDFGLALYSTGGRITEAGHRMGTPAYMSPEQIQSQQVDRRADLWSLGVVLFEMLTGRLPFREDEGRFSVLFSIVRDDPPRARELRPEIPPLLDETIARALAKNPRERWQTAGQISAALRGVRSALPALDATLPLAAPVLPKSSRRLWLAAGALVLLGALGVVLGSRRWSGRSPLPPQKQVAVLPFHVVGGDQSLQTMADGLVETLTSQLSQVEQFAGELMVVPASEVRSRKIRSAAEARRIYGANLVITGSAEQRQGKLQLALNLVDTNTLRQAGTRTLAFDSQDWIAMREGAIAAAVRLLEIRLSKPASQAVAIGETAKPAAYSEYLKGRGYLARRDLHGNLDRAIVALESAVRLDPNYALAHAGLAEAYWQQSTAAANAALASKALASAEMALRLDPALTLARVRRGEILLRTGHREEGLHELQAALAEAPKSPDAALALADFYTSSGRFPEAEAAYKQAVDRKPTNWHGHLMLGYFYARRGRFGEARHAYETALKLTPGNEIVMRNLASLDLRQGRYKEASLLFQQVVLYDQSALSYSGLGLAYYYQRRFTEAAAALESAIDLRADNYSMWGNLGTVYRHLPGSEEKARLAFGKAIELANKALAVTPGDHRIQANLAEYYAKLGGRQRALSAIEAIPTAARRPYMGRIALAYELLGERAKAIETVVSLLADRSELSEIRDDADLAGLWEDRGFQKAIAALTR